VRNIATVIDALLLIIPEGEEHVRRCFKAILEDRWNSPEALWYKGALVFFDRFGEILPESGWGKAAVDLWVGRVREGGREREGEREGEGEGEREGERVGEREGDADDGGLGSAVIENAPPTKRVSFFERVRTFFRGLSRRSFQ